MKCSSAYLLVDNEVDKILVRFGKEQEKPYENFYRNPSFKKYKIVNKIAIYKNI